MSTATTASLAHALLFVSDLPRMAQLYEQVFGLTRGRVEDGFLLLAAPGGGAGVALHTIPPEVAGPISAPAAWREDSYVKLCFAVADLEAARARVEEHGGQSRDPWSWQGRSYSECVDPEGNRLQLFTSAADSP